MEEAHVREHQDLLDELVAVGLAKAPHEGAKDFEAFCKRMLGHMAREEQVFLNASVLRDDGVAIDAEDG